MSHASKLIIIYAYYNYARLYVKKNKESDVNFCMLENTDSEKKLGYFNHIWVVSVARSVMAWTPRNKVQNL